MTLNKSHIPPTTSHLPKRLIEVDLPIKKISENAIKKEKKFSVPGDISLLYISGGQGKYGGIL